MNIKIWFVMLGLLISFALNPGQAQPKGGDDSEGGGEKLSLLDRLQHRTQKKQKLCNKYCHTAFRSGSWNPLKQAKSFGGLSSTPAEIKCKKLCKGRGYIYIMDGLRRGLKKRKGQEKHDLSLGCTKYARKYLREIFGWSCNRTCEKKEFAKVRGNLIKIELKGYERVLLGFPCHKSCKARKAAFQKLALSFCAGSFSHNPLVMLLHMRQVDYEKPIKNVKAEVEEFWKKFKTTINGRSVHKSPDKVLWTEGDISAVIFQDNDDDEDAQSKKRKKRRPAAAYDDDDEDDVGGADL